MPDQSARVVAPLDERDDLAKPNKVVLLKFYDGKLYIQRTFTDPKKQKTMLDAAGDNYYDAATRRNWTSTSALITAFNGFLTTYGQQLIDSNQMPPNFPKEFWGKTFGFPPTDFLHNPTVYFILNALRTRLPKKHGSPPRKWAGFVPIGDIPKLAAALRK